MPVRDHYIESSNLLRYGMYSTLVVRGFGLSLDAKSLYIHIPFCSFACHYCDFSKTSDLSKNLVANYFEILKTHLHAEMSNLAPNLETVYFGGGTPGLFTSDFSGVLSVVSEHIVASTELTLEVNPNNLSIENLRYWQQLGFNRYSVGVQSFNPSGLKVLTRDHSLKQTIEAIGHLKSYADNWSLDLIYGWHGQTIGDWEADIKEAVNQNPPHISIYNLTYEPGTPYFLSEKRGRLKKPDQQVEERMYALACKLLAERGYEHYELASWSMPGMQSKHNSRYWDLGACVAIGSGAHGFRRESSSDPGVRYAHTKDIQSYIRDWESPTVEEGRSTSDLILELGLVRLRTRKGLVRSEISRIAGESYAEDLWVSLSASELIAPFLSKDSFILSEEKWFVENTYLREFHRRMEEVKGYKAGQHG